jgi:hypothetical protein
MEFEFSLNVIKSMSVFPTLQGIFRKDFYDTKEIVICLCSKKTAFTSSHVADTGNQGDGVPLEPRQPPMTPTLATAMVGFCGLETTLGRGFFIG